MEIKADIIDYMGKFEDGVLVLLSVLCDGEYSEGTVYYSDVDLVLTVDRSVEDSLGTPIEEWPGYRKLLESIFARLVPASEILTRIDDVDFESFIDFEDALIVDEEVDDELIVATYSNFNQ